MAGDTDPQTVNEDIKQIHASLPNPRPNLCLTRYMNIVPISPHFIYILIDSKWSLQKA